MCTKVINAAMKPDMKSSERISKKRQSGTVPRSEGTGQSGPTRGSGLQVALRGPGISLGLGRRGALPRFRFRRCFLGGRDREEGRRRKRRPAHEEPIDLRK